MQTDKTVKHSKGIIYVLMAAMLFSIGGLCIKLVPFFQVGLAYILMSKRLDEVPAVTAILTTAVEPILNPLLVAVFYHEVVTPLFFVGAVIVVAAVVGYNVWKAVKTS